MRSYSFAGVVNFRDFGNCPTSDGRHVVAGRLFRGGHQGLASPSDIKKLDGLQIGLVADLRRSFECSRDPRVWPKSGTAEIIVDTSDGSPTDLPYVEFLRKPDVTPDDVITNTRNAYRSIPYDSVHIELFSAYLSQLAMLDCASLVSCTHGKDRTGILCGLLLQLLGVEYELIIEDYKLTNAGLAESVSVVEAQRAFANTYDISLSLEVMASIISVYESYLDTAFDEIRARSGSIDGYLDMLGITESVREQLRARLLV